jgi:hypothetical protein
MAENNIINLTNNNNILIDIAFKLEDIIDALNDTNINNKMKEIVNLMNKVINENKKILEQMSIDNNTNEIIKDDNDEIKEIINKNNNAL